MRLFTAIDLPDPLRNDLASLSIEDELPARPTPPEQLHVTLRFIGETSKEQAERYREALADVDLPSVRCAPHSSTPIGVLPSRRSPRVVMMELEKTDSLLALYDAVSSRLEDEGLEPEERTYRPHVTLARLDDADPEAVHSFLSEHEDRSFPPFQMDQFVLYESTLTPDGANHDPYAVYPLSS